MKKNYFLTLLFIAFTCATSFAQNGIIGDGFGTNDWSTTDNFTSSAGNSRITTLTPNGTADRYFRMVEGDGTQLGPFGCSDTNWTAGVNSKYENMPDCGSGAFYINCPNTTDNYVFKTPGQNENDFIYFRVQGTVRTVSSVNTPSTTYPGQTNTITATLDGALPTGQSVYLRYTNNAYATSTVVEMTGAGTSYTANIPSGTNTVSANVSYYIFTSGNGLTISSGDADWYTINLNNNTGSNYSYTVSSSYASKADGNWSETATWMNNSIPDTAHNVVIENDVTLNQDDTVASITVSATKSLTLNATNGLTVSGNLSNSGTLTVNSGASLIVNGTSVGNIKYNAHVSDTNWHLVSSPVAGATYNDTWIVDNDIASGTTFTTNRGISTYDNTGSTDPAIIGEGGHWRYTQGAASGTFGAGVGYALIKDVNPGVSSGNFSFTGTYPEGTITPAISQSVNHWNLIGNPYPSYIDIATFISTNSANLGAGAFQSIYVWNATGGTYDDLQTGYVHPGQAFFINSNVASGNASFTEAMQSHQTMVTFYKSSTTSIKLILSNGTSTKNTKINYLEGKTTSLDAGFDIGMFDGVISDLRVYTHLIENNQGIAFAKQALPSSDIEAMVVPVGVKATANTEITISAEALNLPTGIKVFLEDKVSNTFTRLDEANSEFKITLTDAVNGVGRFYLYTTQSTLGAKDVVLNGVNIFKSDASTIRISGLPQGNATVSLFNILGKQVMTTSFEAKTVKDISLPKLATGIYFAKVQTETGKVSKKIILE